MKWMLLILSLLISKISYGKETIRVGSKNFTESYILAEIISQLIEQADEARVERKFGMSGTGINSTALINGSIDLYPEYTGTISQVILKKPEINSIPEINQELAQQNLEISPSLGFSNNYALSIRKKLAHEHKIKTISDLKKLPPLIGGFTHEFLKREDGLPGLKNLYALHFKALNPLEHSLAYEAIKSGNIDVMEVYTTDGKIPVFELEILDDNLNYFPKYEAVIFHNASLKNKFPKSYEKISGLFQTISSDEMQRLNGLVDDGNSYTQVATHYLKKNSIEKSVSSFIPLQFGELTLQHLYLVMTSLAFSIIAGIPLGYAAHKSQVASHLILMITGTLQTIPSLALLCFLLPLFGIGDIPSLIALFLYGLLPIVRGTLTGLQSITFAQHESAMTLGLTKWQRLSLIELPLALPNIVAGIKTTGVINVGMATLAAFIGAGGYGTLIVMGLSLNDNQTILQGAIPSAIMAIVIHLFFERVEVYIVSPGLQKK